MSYALGTFEVVAFEFLEVLDVGLQGLDPGLELGDLTLELLTLGEAVLPEVADGLLIDVLDRHHGISLGLLADAA